MNGLSAGAIVIGEEIIPVRLVEIEHGLNAEPERRWDMETDTEYEIALPENHTRLTFRVVDEIPS